MYKNLERMKRLNSIIFAIMIMLLTSCMSFNPKHGEFTDDNPTLPNGKQEYLIVYNRFELSDGVFYTLKKNTDWHWYDDLQLGCVGCLSIPQLLPHVYPDFWLWKDRSKKEESKQEAGSITH